MACLPTRTVLAIDRNPRNLQLLMQFLDSKGFATLPVPDLAQLDATLARCGPVGLALVDVDGFDTAIWERCRQLRERNIGVLVLVARHAAPAVQVEGARCGAQAVLPKPMSSRLLGEMVCKLMDMPA